ncbi:DUF1127 domain-containing protein [Dongia deserti]|uniref:DUF1127 domain-containing protein n=1 Tax=Dongia deserti TaxID=2268030 RepID=UPI000E659607|nr:DUF1127 domain-containing protein [Dongia deserti]
MTDLTTACPALPRGLRQQDRCARALAGQRDLIRMIARMMSWIWAQWRRREIIRALNKVDDHLLRDAGIERGQIEEFVDTLMARWR